MKRGKRKDAQGGGRARWTLVVALTFLVTALSVPAALANPILVYTGGSPFNEGYTQFGAAVGDSVVESPVLPAGPDAVRLRRPARQRAAVRRGPEGDLRLVPGFGRAAVRARRRLGILLGRQRDDERPRGGAGIGPEAEQRYLRRLPVPQHDRHRPESVHAGRRGDPLRVGVDADRERERPGSRPHRGRAPVRRRGGNRPRPLRALGGFERVLGRVGRRLHKPGQRGARPQPLQPLP